MTKEYAFFHLFQCIFSILVVLPPSENKSTFKAVIIQTFLGLAEFVEKSTNVFDIKRIHHEIYFDNVHV
jgi:hypothetical protein